MANGQTDNFNVTAFYDYDGEDWNLGTVGGGFANSAIDDFSYTGGGTYSLTNIPAQPTTAPGMYYAISGTVTESGVDHTDHSYSGIITGFGGTVSTAGSGSANVTQGSNFAYSGSGSYTSIIDDKLTVNGQITAHSGHTNDNSSFTSISTLNGTTGGEWQTTGGGEHVYSTGGAFASHGAGLYESDVTTSTDNGNGYTSSTHNIVKRSITQGGDSSSNQTWTSAYDYAPGVGMKLTTVTYAGDSHSMSDFTSLNFSSSDSEWADTNSSDGVTGDGNSSSKSTNNRHSHSDVTTTDRLVGSFGSSGNLLDIAGTQRTDATGDGYVEIADENHNTTHETIVSGDETRVSTYTWDATSSVRDAYNYTGFTLVTWDSSAEPSGSGSGSGSSGGSGSGSGESSGSGSGSGSGSDSGSGSGSGESSGSGSGTSNPPPIVYPYTIERGMDNHVTGHKNWSSGSAGTTTITHHSSSGSSGSGTGMGTESSSGSGSGSGSGSSGGSGSMDAYGNSGSGTSGYYDGSSGSGSGSGTSGYSDSMSGSGSGSGTTSYSDSMEVAKGDILLYTGCGGG